MVVYDFFELTKLPFDPPEKAAKKVSAAIEKTVKDLGTALGSATQQIERDRINGELKFLQDRKSEVLTPDGKLTTQYEALSKSRVDRELENLKSTVNFLIVTLKGKGRIVTNGTIKTQTRKTKLSKENVEFVYKQMGFTIKEIDPISAMPKFPTNAERIYDELAALRRAKDPNPLGADVTMAVDMYAFIAYLKNEPNNAVEYRGKTTTELASILDDYSKRFSTRNDDLGKLCASLSTAGKTFIFKSDNSRHAYELHLRYKSPELSALFDVLKRSTPADLVDSKFADACIEQIADVFNNSEVALAIYNSEAGLKDDPYIPEKASYSIKCVHCNSFSEFTDVNEAQKTNKCSQCSKPLFQQCSRCKKTVLTSADKCPECSYVFASKALFSKYVTLAEQALTNGDFDVAQQYLVEAKLADPGEKAKTVELSARISSAIKTYEKPINDLRQLISSKKYQEAEAVLARTISSFPKLNVSSFESQIKSITTKAQMTYDEAKKRSATERADICIDILNYCVDYKPAIMFLKDHHPSQVNGLALTVDSKLCSATITWQRTGERGVSYKIVRKTGEVAPVNEMDGDTLIDGTTESIYRDEKLTPGSWYSYTVFAKRMGVSSPASSKTVLLVADVTDVRHEQIDKSIRITWNAPKNCSGVKITRSCEGKEINLTNNAHGSFEDKNVEYSKSYSYKIQANYFGLPSSMGVSIIVTPLVKIEDYEITVSHVKGNKYNVTWKIKQRGIDVRVIVNKKVVRETKSDNGSIEIDLPIDGFHAVEVAALSGGSWLSSQNTVQVNTYTPCEIDKEQTTITEKQIVGSRESSYNIELLIKMSRTIPSNAQAFWYVVRSKLPSSKQAPWAESTEIRNAPDVYKVTVETYQKSGEIHYTAIANEEDSFYVTMFTVYNANGKEVISSPHKRRFARPTMARVLWKVTKPFLLLSSRKLSIEIKPNRPIASQPRFVLCASKNGQHLLTPKDQNAEILLEVKEQEFASPQRTVKADYEIPSLIERNRKLFLFVVTSDPNENYSLHWAEGFTGKV
jgi:hypothetical protein